MHSVHARVGMLAIASLLLGEPAQAEEVRAAAGGGNLTGVRGLLRTSSAMIQPRGFIGFGADFQFYTAGGLYKNYAGSDLATAPTTTPVDVDHARMVYTYTLSFAPSKYFEAAFALNVISDDSTIRDSNLSAEDASQLQVAVGDPQLVLKGGYELIPGLALGGMVDIIFPAGSGFNEIKLSATSVFFAALATYRVSNKLPLSVHLNVGYFLDGSKEILGDPSEFNAAQRFAAQYSDFDRFILRFGLEYETKYVGPFIELSLEPFMGSGAPGFGDSPGRLSIGARGWLGKRKNVQLLAAVDIGLTGVGPYEEHDRRAFVIPAWNLALRFSYRFDAFSGPEEKIVYRDKTGGKDGGKDQPPPTAPKLATITGKVVDARTGNPIWNARVRIPKSTTSSLAVDTSGQFQTFELPVGKRELEAFAKGYKKATVAVSLTESGSEVTIKLEPRQIAPAVLEVLVRTVRGKPIRGAAVMIPQLNKQVVTGRDGRATINAPPGSYQVIISKRGYRTQRKKERITEGQNRKFNIELHR
jgi:hypothetical protein